MQHPYQTMISLLLLFMAHNYWLARIRRDGSWKATFLVTHRQMGRLAQDPHCTRKIVFTAVIWAGIVNVPLWFDWEGIGWTMAAIVLVYLFGLTATFDAYLKELGSEKK